MPAWCMPCLSAQLLFERLRGRIAHHDPGHGVGEPVALDPRQRRDVGEACGPVPPIAPPSGIVNASLPAIPLPS